MGFIREGNRLDFRAEAFNVFNSQNLNNPNVQFSCSSVNDTTTALQPCPISATTGEPGFAGTFDEITNTLGPNAALTSNGRKLQLSLVYTY
jgi:hypothetical protein